MVFSILICWAWNGEEFITSDLITTIISDQKASPGSVLSQRHGDVHKDDSVADHENGNILCCRPIYLVLQRPLWDRQERTLKVRECAS